MCLGICITTHNPPVKLYCWVPHSHHMYIYRYQRLMRQKKKWAKKKKSDKLI